MSHLHARPERRVSPPPSPVVVAALNPAAEYFTVSQLADKLKVGDEEIRSAIRFEALAVTKHPVRGALRFRIEAAVARAFARKFYAALI